MSDRFKEANKRANERLYFSKPDKLHPAAIRAAEKRLGSRSYPAEKRVLAQEMHAAIEDHLKEIGVVDRLEDLAFHWDCQKKHVIRYKEDVAGKDCPICAAVKDHVKSEGKVFQTV